MQRLFLYLLLSATLLSLSHARDTFSVGIYQSVVSKSISKTDFLIGIEVFAKEYAENVGYDAKFTYFTDPKHVAEAFKSRDIDAIISDPLTISKALPRDLLRPGFMGYKLDKKASNTLLLLAQADDTTPLSRLLYKRVAATDDPAIGLYFKTLCLKNGIDPETTQLNYVKTPHNGILQLFFKKVDLVLADRASYELALELNPQLKERITILKATPLTLGPVLYIHKDFDEDSYQRLKASALALNENERGRQLMQLFRSNSMDIAPLSDMDSVTALLNEYEALLQQIKRP